MNAQLAEKEVNVWGGLVVKRVSLWGASILCRVWFHSPPQGFWISRWAWFGLRMVGLSIAYGTDTVIDSVRATWRTEKPGDSEVTAEQKGGISFVLDG